MSQEEQTKTGRGGGRGSGAYAAMDLRGLWEERGQCPMFALGTGRGVGEYLLDDLRPIDRGEEEGSP
jgi:hypothetical protein